MCILCCRKAAKKASACAISADGNHIFFSDRFGDILTAATVPPTAAAGATAAEEEPNLLLGHLQAIISSLTTCEGSNGQRLLISTDRDGKVRASVLPKDPTKVWRLLLPHSSSDTSPLADSMTCSRLPRVLRDLSSWHVTASVQLMLTCESTCVPW